MNNKLRQILGFGLLGLFATIGRYLLVSAGMQPFPNFEVVTIAAFIGVMILDIRIALFIPLIGMVCSDILIGNPIFVGEKMNQIAMFTYSGFAFIALTSFFVGDRIKPYVSSMKLRSMFCIAGAGALLVFLYDVWTNFGWWYLMYPHMGEALLTVYILGVPFMVYHLISGITTFVCIGLPVVSYFSSKHSIVLRRKTDGEAWKRGIPVAVVTLLLAMVSLTGCISASVDRDASAEIVKNVSIRISSLEWNIAYVNVTTTNVSVADLLFECAERYNFSVNANFWQGYNSLFVEAINDIENGEDGRYWQYYVNDRFADVGCSNYFLEDNDVVEWRFEQPSWA